MIDVGSWLGLSLYLVSHSQETFLTWKSKNFKRIKTKTQDSLMPQHKSTTILFQPHFISQSKFECQPRLKWELCGWIDHGDKHHLCMERIENHVRKGHQYGDANNHPPITGGYICRYFTYIHYVIYLHSNTVG